MFYSKIKTINKDKWWRLKVLKSGLVMEDRLYSPSFMLVDWLIHYNKYVVFQFTSIQFFSKVFVYIVHFVKVQSRFCCDRRVDTSCLPVVAMLPVSIAGLFFCTLSSCLSVFIWSDVQCIRSIRYNVYPGNNPLTRLMWLSYRNKRICFIWEWWGQILVKRRH